MFPGQLQAKQEGGSFPNYNNVAQLMANSVAPVSTGVSYPMPSVQYQTFSSSPATNTATVSDNMNLAASHTLTITIPARSLLVNPNSIVPIMTAGTTAGVTVTADSYHSGGQEGWRAFSGGSYWTSNSTSAAWLQIQFPTPQWLQMYFINANDDVNSPKSWTFQGSNDGTNWHILDTQTSVANAYLHQQVLASPAYYSYYRFYGTAVNGGGNTIIIGMALFNTIANMTLIMNGGFPNGTAISLEAD